MVKQKKPKSKSYQVRWDRYEKLEERARQLRTDTGADVKWTDVLADLIDENLPIDIEVSDE